MRKEPFFMPRNPEFVHLLTEHDGTCWWCGALADSKEHKFKRTDLERLRGTKDSVVWGSSELPHEEVRSIRKNPLVRFQPSLCQHCNTTRSQPFDRAYETYADYVSANMHRMWRKRSLPIRRIYGADWLSKSHDLARYFAKHFGCRMIDAGIPAPDALRDFMNGLPSYQLHFAFVKIRSLRDEPSRHAGCTLTSPTIFLNAEKDRITGVVMSNLIGYVGIRMEWHDESWMNPDSFMGYGRAILNPYRDERLV